MSENRVFSDTGLEIEPSELGDKLFTAYQAVLGRKPDQVGYQNYMKDLKGRDLTQANINNLLANNTRKLAEQGENNDDTRAAGAFLSAQAIDLRNAKSSTPSRGFQGIAEAVKKVIENPMTSAGGSSSQERVTPQNELGDKIFAGYDQLFGRPPDKDGFDYWMESFGGRDLDQAQINKSLLAGAQGSDVTSSLDYGLSLTGGRPDSVQDRVARGQTGQFFQPILQLGRPKDYMPTERAPKQTFFSEGFNPLDYTAGPQVQSSGTYNPFFAGTSTDLGEQIAKGYQQVFGRPPDKEGYDYWMNSFAGQNLDQAGINKALFAGAQGEDISSSLMREGSENPYASRMQSMQGTPQTLQSRSVNPDVGTFNPFSGGQNTYTPGSFNPFNGGQNPYAARMQSLQGGPTQGNNIPAPLNNQPTGNPFIQGELASVPMSQNDSLLAAYLAAYGQEGGVGQGGNVQGVSGQGDSGQGGTVG